MLVVWHYKQVEKIMDTAWEKKIRKSISYYINCIYFLMNNLLIVLFGYHSPCIHVLIPFFFVFFFKWILTCLHVQYHLNNLWVMKNVDERVCGSQCLNFILFLFIGNKNPMKIRIPSPGDVTIGLLLRLLFLPIISMTVEPNADMKIYNLD